MARVQSVRFVAYGCPEAQPHMRWVGEVLLQPAPTPSKPTPVEQPFGLRFWAKTKDHAIARAQAWWTAEQAEIAAKKEATAKRAGSTRRAAA